MKFRSFCIRIYEQFLHSVTARQCSTRDSEGYLLSDIVVSLSKI